MIILINTQKGVDYMTNYIDNGIIKVGVKSFGATLTSIVSKKSGYEFLWQGNPTVWNGQSPILFPIIGKLLNDECIINGKTYSIIRHGLARHREFEPVVLTENEIVFLQKENADTLKCYPYKYELYITFKITDNKLTVTHKVINTNAEEMYFSIGAHPAFNCNLGDTLTFEYDETLYSEKIDRDSVITGDKDLILQNCNKIELTEHLFDKDALIFSNVKSNYVILNEKKAGKHIRFTFGDSPFLAIWAKPAAPFVCIEPWYGVNDSYEKATDFSKKRGIQKLSSGEKFEFSWSAEFKED